MEQHLTAWLHDSEILSTQHSACGTELPSLDCSFCHRQLDLNFATVSCVNNQARLARLQPTDRQAPGIEASGAGRLGSS